MSSQASTKVVFSPILLPFCFPNSVCSLQRADSEFCGIWKVVALSPPWPLSRYLPLCSFGSRTFQKKKKIVCVGRTGIRAINSVVQHGESKKPDLDLVVVSYYCITDDPQISMAKTADFSITGLRVSWKSIVIAVLSLLLSESIFSSVK